jgi:hypothetical protein
MNRKWAICHIVIGEMPHEGGPSLPAKYSLSHEPLGSLAPAIAEPIQTREGNAW